MMTAKFITYKTSLISNENDQLREKLILYFSGDINFEVSSQNKFLERLVYSYSAIQCGLQFKLVNQII